MTPHDLAVTAEQLRDLLPPGSVIYGISRDLHNVRITYLDLYAIRDNEPVHLNALAARLLDLERNSGGNIVLTGPSNTSRTVTYSIARSIWGEQATGKTPAQVRALRRWESDNVHRSSIEPGLCLTFRWL